MSSSSSSEIGSDIANRRPSFLQNRHDPGAFLIPLIIQRHHVGFGLVDTGMELSFLPLHIVKQIGLFDKVNLRHEAIERDGVELCAIGRLKHLPVSIGRMKFTVTFTVMRGLNHIEIVTPIILGRIFLKQANAEIDFRNARLTIYSGLESQVHFLQKAELESRYRGMTQPLTEVEILEQEEEPEEEPEEYESEEEEPEENEPEEEPEEEEPEEEEPEENEPEEEEPEEEEPEEEEPMEEDHVPGEQNEPEDNEEEIAVGEIPDMIGEFLNGFEMDNIVPDGVEEDAEAESGIDEDPELVRAPRPAPLTTPPRGMNFPDHSQWNIHPGKRARTEPEPLIHQHGEVQQLIQAIDRLREEIQQGHQKRRLSFSIREWFRRIF